MHLDDDAEIERVSYRGVDGGVAFLVHHTTGELYEVPAGRSGSLNVRSIRDRALRPIAPKAPSRPKRSAWLLGRLTAPARRA